MYRQQTATSVEKLSSYLGVSKYLVSKQLEAGTLVPSPEGLATLAAETGIAESVWMNDSEKLPDDLSKKPDGRGRPTKKVTQTGLVEQRQIALRLRQFISAHYEGNQRAFAQATFIDEGRLSRLLGNKNEITEVQILDIARLTGASAHWLRTGKGSMLEEDAPNLVPIVEEQHDGKYLTDFLKRKGISWTGLQKILGLKSLSSLTGSTGYRSSRHIRLDTKTKIATALKVPVNDIFPVQIHASVQPYIEDDYAYIEMPHLPEYARAGLDAERYFEQPQETVRVRLDDLPMNLRKRKWWSVTVNGDSMDPQLAHGDNVYAYVLDFGEWHTIHNKVVVVQFANQVVIKRIKSNRLEADKGLWLHSDNPKADPFFVPIDDIQGIWLVVSRHGSIH